jgi:imidazolonepropionase-like amidohydrolase
MNSLRPSFALRGVALALSLTPLLLFSGRAAVRPASTPIAGLHEASPRVHALVGGRIVVAPGQVIERGTLVLRDGLIEAVGADVTPPADARVWDVTGRTLYAGFIESDATLFLPEAWKPATARPAGDAATETPPAATPARPEAATGTHSWNARVTPEHSAARALAADAKGAEKLRALGFSLANVAPARGIFRGSAALVSTGGPGFNAAVVRAATTQEVAFEFGANFFSERVYPNSLMGSIALVRQTLLDAQWYAAVQAAYAGHPGVERPETNESLAALGPVIRGEQTAMFELTDELDVARALKVADEFKLRVALRGTGTEYRVRDLLAKAGVTVVLPLDFPEVPEVESPAKSGDVQLQELQQWELAPSNAARLAGAGVPVAFTTAKLKKPESEFWPHVRKAVARGLGADRALAALTTTPAGLLGVAATQGTLEKGRTANVVVASGDLFKADDAAVELVWVDGEPFEQETWQKLDARGTWKFSWVGAKGPDEIGIRGGRGPQLRAKIGDKNVTVTTPEKNTLLMLMPAELFGATGGMVRLGATGKGDEVNGSGELPDGTVLRWSARRTAPAKAEPPAEARAGEEKFFATTDAYPAGSFGRKAAPAQPDSLLFRNATVWTSGPAGVIEGGDVLVSHGRIEQVGKNLVAPAGAQVVDATGKHITPGLIDCHSHTAISRGVNEGGSAITVEVRIGDVIDPTDIGIYRELAGGVTAANILHGSANPMGGQNQVIKLRWGAGAEELKFAGAKPGVKFALGENVVQTYFAGTRKRYPLSRMGVPEIMLDTFNRARDYERNWADFRAGRAPLPPRRDLRLEAALEILHGDRLIHMHSYRQDEVLAFIRLAEQLHLPVATFQHILEGYKVAPEIAKLGAGGSTFSDWWAYKFEVYDAIPYNGVLMHDAGITVSFNSDSGELARRLNTEAAKAVKYGGLAPAEALKFVTINPAKQLQIDSRVGSLEPGKDADLVVWNGSPLSTMTRADQTWIDGRRYFDREEDRQMRTSAATERLALLQKALTERQKLLARGGDPGGGDGPPGETARPAEADHDHDEYRAIYHNGSDTHNCSTHEGGR